MEPKPCLLLRPVASLDFLSLYVVYFWTWPLRVWKNHTASLVNSRQRFNSFPVNSNKGLKVCHLHLKIHSSFCNCVTFSPPSPSLSHHYASSFSLPLKVFPFSRSFMVIGERFYERQPGASSQIHLQQSALSQGHAAGWQQSQVFNARFFSPRQILNLQDHLPPCPVRSWVIMWFSKWQLW